MKTNRKEMAAEVENLHAEGMAALRMAFPDRQAKLDEVDAVPVELSNRMVSCGGRAFTRTMTMNGNRSTLAVKITINARLHELNPGNLRQTYLHELAHIAANLLHNDNCRHDERWAAVMKVLGLSPDKYHKMDCSSLRKARERRLHKWQCVSCGRGYMVTTRMHNRVLRGSARCHCGGGLQHLGTQRQLIG